MRWSKDKPTKEGPYWCRDMAGYISLVNIAKVYRYGLVRLEIQSFGVCDFGLVDEETCDYYKLEWCGPLKAPSYDLD